MRLSKLIVGMVLLAGAAVPGIASPASATHTSTPAVDRGAVPVLAGKTMLEGSETGWLRVRLPKAVETPDQTTISGNGRLIAAYLFEERDGSVVRDGVNFSTDRFGWCAEQACEPSPWASSGSAARTARNGLLPAGTYRLYLIADGAPASVTLRFRGLSGATRLRPRFEAVSALRTMPGHVPGGDVGPLYSAGDEAPFRGQGVSLLGHYFETQAAGVAAFGYCVYPKRAPGDGPAAYLPPECPSRPASSPWVRSFHPLTNGLGFVLGLDGVPAAMGSWHAATAPVESTVTVALWLRTS